MSIALSGMTAAARRLEVSASNVANVSSSGPLPSADPATVRDFPAAYEALRLDQVDVAGGGTATKVGTVSPGTFPTSDPGAPYADAEGLVAAPNVSLEGEVVEQLVARYSYTANVLVARTEAQMMKSLLDKLA